MNKKTVLLTGSSRGLGLNLASGLVEKGYLVYAGTRNINAAPPGTIPLKMDLMNEKSLQTCVDRVIDESGHLDVLINNAAIAYYGAVDSMTLKEVRELFEVNLFGTFRLTQLVLPHMRKQRNGKIFFVSSIRAVESCAYMGMYSASKAALESMAFDWAVTLAKWNISVSVIQPGPLKTGIEIKHGTYFSEDLKNPYLPYGEVQLEWQEPKEAAKIILEKIADPNPPFRFQTSDSAKNTIAKHLKDHSGMEWFLEQKIT